MKGNFVAKHMHKTSKCAVHVDKTDYDRKVTSRLIQEQLEELESSSPQENTSLFVGAQLPEA